MQKKPSFVYQSKVLIARYLHIFFNDKKNLALKASIPLMTIIIVCLVACGEMYSVKPGDDHSINEGYPVLNWEVVVQEKKSEDKDDDENELIKPEKSTLSTWNGKSFDAPMTATKMDGENYFLITDASQLAFLSKAIDLGKKEYLSYNYLLQCDIDLKEKEFTPIGTEEHPFTGTFDGNGHIISNLRITGDFKQTGLFGYVSEKANSDKNVSITNPSTNDSMDMVFKHNGIIKNFQLKDATIKSQNNDVGVLAGVVSKYARITSISIKGGSVRSSGKNVGGLVGRVQGENAQIYMCYSTASVTGEKQNIGGLVGSLGEGYLSGCYCKAKVKAKDSSPKHIGSLVGSYEGKEDHLKNLFYDNEIDKDNLAVDGEDIDKRALGVSSEKLKKYSSFLLPFKDIKAHYDLIHMSKEDKERYDQEDYDVEKDKDIDDEYGFKKDGQLTVFGATQTGLFMLACVAIFTGICNSIQEICKERSILKREYMANLRLGSYVVSKLVVQAVVCAVQMAIIVLIFMLFVKNKQLPEDGVLSSSIWLEYYITLFLLAFAADTMALLISSIVKTSELANTFIPIVLIVQIVFSGVLFEMNGIMRVFANFMISRWGINALAAITSLNDSQPVFLIDNPSLQLQLGSGLSTVSSEYASTAQNLITIWGVLGVFILVSSIACAVLLRSVKNDRR